MQAKDSRSTNMPNSARTKLEKGRHKVKAGYSKHRKIRLSNVSVKSRSETLLGVQVKEVSVLYSNCKQEC